MAAYVTRVFKRSYQPENNNYRSVSILPDLFKIFGKLNVWTNIFFLTIFVQSVSAILEKAIVLNTVYLHY